MHTLAKIAVALTAVASCAAFAQTDSDADRARRERNVDEVLAKHHVNLDQMGSDNEASRPTLHERSHRVAAKTRATTHKIAQSTRDFTHRQAEKVRDFSARQNARFHDKDDQTPAKTPEGRS